MKLTDSSKLDRYIRPYIEGEYVSDRIEQELLNDYESMVKMIQYTGDKNMFYLCSSHLKSNYQFIKFIVDYFAKDNLDFTHEVATLYLDTTNDMLSSIELMLIMKELTKDSKYYRGYLSNINCFYSDEMDEVKQAKLSGKIGNSNLTGIPDEGFKYIFDKYKASNRVVEFFANGLISDILLGYYESPLEVSIHNDFTNPEQLQTSDIRTYLINLIGRYDAFLSAYVSRNIHLLKDLIGELPKIKANWDLFEAKNEAKKYEIMFEQVNRYISNTNNGIIIDEYDLLLSIGKELGVEDKIAKYLDIDHEDNNSPEIDPEIDITSPEDLVRYQNVKNIMENILSQRVVSEPPDDYSTPSTKIPLQTGPYKKLKPGNKN